MGSGAWEGEVDAGVLATWIGVGYKYSGTVVSDVGGEEFENNVDADLWGAAMCNWADQPAEMEKEDETAMVVLTE